MMSSYHGAMKSSTNTTLSLRWDKKRRRRQRSSVSSDLPSSRSKVHSRIITAIHPALLLLLPLADWIQTSSAFTLNMPPRPAPSCWTTSTRAALELKQGLERRQRSVVLLSSSSSSESASEETDTRQESIATEVVVDDDNIISKLRVSEIKSELKERGIDYSDCFDKESLVERLIQSRTQSPQSSTVPPTQEYESTMKTTSSATSSRSSAASSSSTQSESPPPSSKSTTVGVDSIRALSIKELKTELASRNIRWGGLLEKEDLIQAVIQARRAASEFSATGLIAPGQVADLTEEHVRQELQFVSSTSSFLLLDVYATWCGPCQMMTPILQQTANDLSQVRFAKMDSDQYPTLASELRVQGLPTLLLFHNGREVARLEGALPKQQLVEWVQEKMKNTVQD